MRKRQPPPKAAHPAIERARWVAGLMDSAIRVPIVGWKIGLDPILGMLPVSGDVISSLISVYLVVVAYQLSLPRHILMRMSANIALDLVLGLVPVVGDVADFFWKSNRYNLKLLEEAYLQYGSGDAHGGVTIDIQATPSPR